MRTQTEITLHLSTYTPSQNLAADPQGFVIKVFLSCSRADSKVFKIHSNVINLNQTLRIKNICAKQLQFWLCTTHDKIIALASIHVNNQDGPFNLDFKMLATDFGKLEGNISTRQYEIQKQVIIEPDQQLLKKVEDPLQKKKKQQQQARKVKEAAQALQAAKNVKKPAVTLTRFNKKDEPFV